ncbi:MAG: type II toxin-antitoxin system HicA family toxin [Patescibacteria group bacterium]
MSRLPRPTGKEVVRFLERRGFSIVRVRGSHHYLGKGNIHVAVPVHGNRTLPIGTLLGILEDIGMSREEFMKLWQER